MSARTRLQTLALALVATLGALTDLGASSDPALTASPAPREAQGTLTPATRRAFLALWWSPSNARVGVGRGVDLETARAAARRDVGLPDAEEAYWTQAPSFSGLALFRNPEGDLDLVMGPGFRTRREFLEYAIKRAARMGYGRLVALRSSPNA